MSNTIKRFLQNEENQDLINKNNFNELYYKALDEFKNILMIQELIEIIQDAGIKMTLKNTFPYYDDYLEFPIKDNHNDIIKCLDQINKELKNNILFSDEHHFKLSTLRQLFYPKQKVNAQYDFDILSDIKVKLSLSPSAGVCISCEYERGRDTYCSPIYYPKDMELTYGYGLGIAYDLAILQGRVDQIIQKLKSNV